MSTPQTGILDDIPSLARYLSFSLVSGADPRQALQDLGELVDGHAIVVGLGSSLVKALGADVPGLRTFPALTGPGVEIPATPGALWCWLRGDDRGELLHRGRQLENLLFPAFELDQVTDAFRYRDGRDLTGYEDGTENPDGDDAMTTAVVENRGAGLDGASFVVIQQWVHNLDEFQAMDTEEQDHAIGRRRSDNEELDDAPVSAHVKRTAQESFDPEAFVLRRSMPWVEETESGLMFVAFGHSFDAFEAQLNRMIGQEDGIIDGLFRFTRPVTGRYYWCPPMMDGRLDLSALGITAE